MGRLLPVRMNRGERSSASTPPPLGPTTCPEGLSAPDRRRVDSQFRQLGGRGPARFGAPAGHLVVDPPRGQELGGIDPLALERAVADPLLQPRGQYVVVSRAPLPSVEVAH